MNFIRFILILLVGFYVVEYVSNSVLTNRYYLAIILLIIGVAFFYTTFKQKFILLSFLVFFPVSFTSGFKLPVNRIYELIAPAICFAYFLELLLKQKPFIFRKSSIIYAAIAILALCSIVNYIRHPVLGYYTFGSDISQGGLRQYYIIVVGISIFLLSSWFFRYEKVNIRKSLLIFLIITLLLGNLRLIGYFLNIDMPVLPYLFKESMMEWEREGLQVGISGLREMSTLGLALLLGLTYRKGWSFIYVMALINILVFSVLGGGRAQFLGVVLAVIVYITLFKRRFFFPVMAILLLVACLNILVMSDISVSEHKYARVFAFEGGFKKQSEGRYFSFIYMWEAFKESPLLGHGIGYHKFEDGEELFRGYKDDDSVHLRKMIEQGVILGGGHGAYLSIITIFGIFGGLYFIGILGGSIYFAYRIIKCSKELKDNKELVPSAFFYITMLTMLFLSVGTGYNDVYLWYLSGLIVGVNESDEGENVQSQ
jgi:O-antigen ligase